VSIYIQVIDWMTQILPVKTIGPAIPSVYLDKRLQGDKEYGLNVFQPNTDACITWLNQRSEESVVYVSFGSLAVLNAKQMEELAWGLRSSNKHFLWVVRKSEEEKLPKGFLEETTQRGLVVSWCPQLQVLAHKSIGCFLTHSGWNSTLESLSLGVPMVVMPQWTDQTTNAKFVMDIWKMGIKVKSDGDNGIVRRDVIERCIRQVMEGEKAKEFRRNVTKWKELARKAVDEGGSSDQNIKEFVSKLVSSLLN
jgi:pathogen-inducible salicylic acid glucosyltransferase